ARELEASRPHLLGLRHAVQARAAAAADGGPLPDASVEADELYRNAGEKRRAAPRSRVPAVAAGPRAAGARQPGGDTAARAGGVGGWELGWRPVCGVRGGDSGRLAVRGGRRNGVAELVRRTVVPRTKQGAMVDTAEWAGYKPLGGAGRGHAAVNHPAGEWAR